MTKEEAWQIIEACKGWNTAQQSINDAKGEQELLDAKRAALAEAWRTVGMRAAPQGEP